MGDLATKIMDGARDRRRMRLIRENPNPFATFMVYIGLIGVLEKIKPQFAPKNWRGRP